MSAVWAVAVVVVVVLVALGVAGRRGYGPAYGLMCPESVQDYVVAPTPDMPVARGTLTVRVGERFAVGRFEEKLPADGHLPTGEATVVRAEGEKIFPTGERCGRIDSGYRYTLFTAVRAGDVSVADAAIHVTG